MPTHEPTATQHEPPDGLREEVRDHYATAARSVLTRGTASCCDPAGEGSCCGPSDTVQPAAGERSDGELPLADLPLGDLPMAGSSSGDPSVTHRSEDEPFGAGLYTSDEQDALPEAAVLASLGCGNPTAVAELREGETVLDLGSGGGIDVLLSARRVGPTGRAIGLDMTDEMLVLARGNAAEAGVDNVEFLAGTMEAIPLDPASVDVVISNCVINLSTDKPAVFAEIARVLRPGGRVGVSDVVAEDRLSPADRAARGGHVGCIAGALSVSEYRAHLADVGLEDAEVELTHEVADGLHGAIVRARRPS